MGHMLSCPQALWGPCCLYLLVDWPPRHLSLWLSVLSVHCYPESIWKQHKHSASCVFHLSLLSSPSLPFQTLLDFVSERSQETRAMEPYPDPRAITRSPLLGDDCQSQIFFKDRLLFTNSWPLGLNKWVHSLYSFSPHQCEDAKAEAPVLWPPHAKSWLIGKDSDAGRDGRQKEKGTTEDEMAGWHDWLDGCESEWTPGVDDRQGGLACCDSWGCKELDTTERLNWTELNWMWSSFFLNS